VKDINNPEMINVGFDLAIFTVAKLVREGVDFTPEAWDQLGNYSAESIQKATDVPAEDLALHVQPIIDRMLEKLK